MRLELSDVDVLEERLLEAYHRKNGTRPPEYPMRHLVQWAEMGDGQILAVVESLYLADDANDPENGRSATLAGALTRDGRRFRFISVPEAERLMGWK